MIHAHNGMIVCDGCNARVYDEEGVKYARSLGWKVNMKTGAARCPKHKNNGKKGEDHGHD